MLGKLLGLASLGEAFLGLSITKKFASSFIVVLALTLVAAIFASALLVFGLFEGSHALVHHGMDPDLAALTMALVGLFFLIVLIFVIAEKVRMLRAIPLAVSRAENMGTSALTVVRGIYKGFTSKKPRF